MTLFIKTLPLILLIGGLSTTGFGQFTIDVEGDYIVNIPYNTVRIPSKGGTRVDIANDLDVNTKATCRGRVTYTIAERHQISALAAPLTIKSSGTFDKDVKYSDRTFSAGEKINATYKFNSYRLTYRYLFITTDQLTLGAGLTGKIRDANITMSAEGKESDYPDLGIVPLVNIYIHWTPTERLGVLLEGDALGTNKGRAEDVFAGVTVKLTPGVALKGGYRILEGGANVADNYNFTFINYAALGALIKL